MEENQISIETWVSFLKNKSYRHVKARKIID